MRMPAEVFLRRWKASLQEVPFAQVRILQYVKSILRWLGKKCKNAVHVLLRKTPKRRLPYVTEKSEAQRSRTEKALSEYGYRMFEETLNNSRFLRKSLGFMFFS